MEACQRGGRKGRGKERRERIGEKKVKDGNKVKKKSTKFGAPCWVSWGVGVPLSRTGLMVWVLLVQPVLLGLRGLVGAGH